MHVVAVVTWHRYMTSASKAVASILLTHVILFRQNATLCVCMVPSGSMLLSVPFLILWPTDPGIFQRRLSAILEMQVNTGKVVKHTSFWTSLNTVTSDVAALILCERWCYWKTAVQYLSMSHIQKGKRWTNRQWTNAMRDELMQWGMNWCNEGWTDDAMRDKLMMQWGMNWCNVGWTDAMRDELIQWVMNWCNEGWTKTHKLRNGRRKMSTPVLSNKRLTFQTPRYSAPGVVSEIRSSANFRDLICQQVTTISQQGWKVQNAAPLTER